MSAEPPDRDRSSTLADVAKAAGVSIATASYVLSNRAGVKISAPTRERVLAVATEKRYRRNALAAALRGRAAREIVVFSVRRPPGAMADIAFACAEVVAARGFSAALQIGAGADFSPGRFDGVILLGTDSSDAIHPRLLDGSVPVVEIGGTASACQIHADDFGGARKAVKHLLSLGHRRIGHYAGPQSHPAYQERLRGFLDAVHEAGLRMDATPVMHGLGDLAEVLRLQDRPTGLLACNDQAGVLVYRECRRVGLVVPTDLAVAGFDDEGYAGLLDPPLTTVGVAPELMAGSAFALLERQFNREQVPTQTLVATSLSVRDSAGG